MEYRFRPQGVCAQEMIIEIDDNGIIKDYKVIGGCNGNGKGISQLVKGMKMDEVIKRLKGVTCGYKQTSCPDQLAVFLEKIKNNEIK